MDIDTFSRHWGIDNLHRRRRSMFRWSTNRTEGISMMPTQEVSKMFLGMFKAATLNVFLFPPTALLKNFRYQKVLHSFDTEVKPKVAIRHLRSCIYRGSESDPIPFIV